MCGIVGFSAKTLDISLSHQRVQQAASQLRLRGPDACAVVSGSYGAIGHTRLAIIDLEQGQQPMLHPETGCILSYNGELYNYRALRQQLQKEGIGFLTSSDTEVVLQSYLHWGPRCLEKFNGMFAFALYDPREQTTLLARDHLGIKPLYYSLTPQSFGYASTIPALRTLFPQHHRICPQALSHYLSTIKLTQGADTLIQGIQQVLPGQYLCYHHPSQQLSTHRYWSIPVLPEADKLDICFQDAADQVRHLIYQSIEQQLISDVPLGGFLSGGLDSTIIASDASHITQGHYHAYTVGYPDPDYQSYNESDYAQQAAQHYGMSCRNIALNPHDFWQDWQYLIQHKGAPLSTPNEIGIYRMAQSLRQEYTVALSGEGADEIFGGYTTPHFCAHDYDRRATSLNFDMASWTPLEKSLYQLYGRTTFASRSDHYLLLNSWIAAEKKQQLLQPQLWAELRNNESMHQFYQEQFAPLQDCSTFNAHMILHAQVNLESLLNRVDSSTMASSVESRVPFTDPKLVELLFQLPDAFKIDWRNPDAQQQGAQLNGQQIHQQNLVESKRLLRHAYQKQVPSHILQRPKMSFPSPFQECLQQHCLAPIKELLQHSPLAQQCFQAQQLQALTDQPQEGNNSLILWPLVNLCLWAQEAQVSL